MFTAFTSKDVDFFVNAIKSLKGSPFLSASEPHVFIQSIERDNDALTLGIYSIRGYTGQTVRKSIRGDITLAAPLFEVTVEIDIPGTRWDPPSVDVATLEPSCSSLADAVLVIINAELNAYVRNVWRCEAEVEAA